MKTRWQIAAKYFFVSLSAAMLLYCVFPTAEPTYHGIEIGDWLNKPAIDPGIYDAYGTNVLKYFVRSLARYDSPSHKKYYNLWSKMPGFIRKILPDPRPHFFIPDAAKAFGYAGIKSMPIAISLLNHKSPTVREFAVYGLILLHQQSPATKDAIPALTAATEDSDKSVSYYAAQALGKMGPEASSAVPALVKLMNRTGRDPYSGFLQVESAWALGKIGPSASSALPELRKNLQTTNSNVRGTIDAAIWRIAGDSDSMLPALLAEIPGGDTRVLGDWIAALGEMGPKAKSAVPLLERELNQNSYFWVREDITNALQRIDPDALRTIESGTKTTVAPSAVEKPH